MFNKTLSILFSIVLVVLLSANVLAGQINNLNVNSTDGSKVEIKTGKNSKIKNIKVKKDSKSKVIINNKEVNCDDPENKGICKP